MAVAGNRDSLISCFKECPVDLVHLQFCIPLFDIFFLVNIGHCLVMLFCIYCCTNVTLGFSVDGQSLLWTWL